MELLRKTLVLALPFLLSSAYCQIEKINISLNTGTEFNPLFASGVDLRPAPVGYNPFQGSGLRVTYSPFTQHGFFVQVGRNYQLLALKDPHTIIENKLVKSTQINNSDIQSNIHLHSTEVTLGYQYRLYANTNSEFGLYFNVAAHLSFTSKMGAESGIWLGGSNLETVSDDKFGLKVLHEELPEIKTFSVSPSFTLGIKINAENIVYSEQGFVRACQKVFRYTFGLVDYFEMTTQYIPSAAVKVEEDISLVNFSTTFGFDLFKSSVK